MSEMKRKVIACATAVIMAFSMVSATAFSAFANDLQAGSLEAQSGDLGTQAVSNAIVYDSVYGVFKGDYALMMKTVTFEVEYKGRTITAFETASDVVHADGAVTVHTSTEYLAEDKQALLPGDPADYELARNSMEGLDIADGFVLVSSKANEKCGVKSVKDGSDIIAPKYDSVSLNQDNGFLGLAWGTDKLAVDFMTTDGKPCGSFEMDVPISSTDPQGARWNASFRFSGDYVEVTAMLSNRDGVQKVVGYAKKGADGQYAKVTDQEAAAQDYQNYRRTGEGLRPPLKMADGTEVKTSVVYQTDQATGEGAYVATVTDTAGSPIVKGDYTLGIAVNNEVGRFQSRSYSNTVKHGNSDLWWAQDKDGNWGAIDSSGAVKVPFRYKSYFDAGASDTDYALVQDGETWKFLNVNKEDADPVSAKSDIVAYEGEAKNSEMADVASSTDWFMDPVKGVFPGTNTLYMDYTISRGLMSGYTDKATGKVTGFAPYDKMTREMVATVIYRMATGKTAETTDYNVTTPFSDAPSGQWYSAAIAWCAENNIVTGYTSGPKKGQFGVGDNVSREQLATMIYRYCTGPAHLYKDAADLGSFPDNGSISPYAKEGVAYCAAKGIVSGYSDSHNFDPFGEAQRCQMAKIIAVTARMVE